MDKNTVSYFADCCSSCNNMFLLKKVNWKKLIESYDFILICISLFVYLLNNFVLKQYMKGSIQDFCRWHLNDLICPLFILGYTRLVFKLFGYNLKSCKLLLLLGLAYGIIFETLGPLINPKSVGDIYDIICFVIGSIIFCLGLRAFWREP